MKKFFNEDVLLDNDISKTIYEEIKNLPIIDYHCHLDETKIVNDFHFTDIGELWLSNDHYKWRAMRLNGIDEYYITGGASYKEKFLKYASIMPSLIGSPLYYWTHLELSRIFDIHEPLNEITAEKIYIEANKKIKDVSTLSLLKKFNVEFIATTDDPISSLNSHVKINDSSLTPTFRPDKVASLDRDYLKELGQASDIEIINIKTLKIALIRRLDYFVSKGCKIADHGFNDFPQEIINDVEANNILNKTHPNDDDKQRFFGWLLSFLLKEYKTRNIIVQLHFAVTRNVNSFLFTKLGPDSGLDVIGKEANFDNIISFLNLYNDEERPTIILYSLNPTSIPTLASISGAFRNVYIGAAWWFNDTLNGIRRNLDYISEYAVLGTNLGMLTDSRSFASYVRFDFFRRILASFIGEKVEKGEYPLDDAIKLAKDISYFNIKNLLKL